MKKIIDFTVRENRPLTDTLFFLTLYAPELPEVAAGQFVNIKVEGSPEIFLRRPISIFDADPAAGLLYLLIKIAGKGTARLAELKKGEKLNILLPLGNTFTLPGKEERILLVGGGVGIAPMHFLAKTLRQKGLHPELLIGVRSCSDVVLRENLEIVAPLHCTTEDGTFGEKGFPTAHSVWRKTFDRIYCCGPDPMMRAVADHAFRKGIACEVSLENTMACGIGACLCCVTETQEGHKCVCTEGPVFNTKALKWQN
ncbi:MAG: dihydroorotate dehydrogenase electron transfer subunit [Culturomica sp.]|jgi:dihydroorotate dehydrogenase electron transfer subunit|nr:dihydroorotate dehydrogenase electron transfer subunit [Culturomica sp.]